MMHLTCSIVRWSNFSSDVTSQKNTFTSHMWAMNKTLVVLVIYGIIVYCWWKKSCTTGYAWNPVNNGTFIWYSIYQWCGDYFKPFKGSRHEPTRISWNVELLFFRCSHGQADETTCHMVTMSLPPMPFWVGEMVETFQWRSFWWTGIGRMGKYRELYCIIIHTSACIYIYMYIFI